MYQNCCKKCGSISLHTEEKGNNIGLYCDDCGAWIKWLGKDELRAFENSICSVTKEETNDNNKTILERLNEFVKFLDKTINSEMEKLPLSDMDAIRKSSYCLALERDKNAIQNIIDGHDFSYTGD